MKEVKSLDYKLKNSFKKLGQAKFVLIVILVGVVLLLIPDFGKKDKNETVEHIGEEEYYSVEELEHKLEQTLSKMENAGHVEVILSVESGVRRVYAQNESLEQRNGELKKDKETVIVSAGSGMEGTVLIQQFYPEFQGALVIASGGGDPAVKLKLTEAISAVTGLGSDRISVCKGK